MKLPLLPIVPPPSFEKDDGIEFRMRMRMHVNVNYPMYYGVFTMPDEPAEEEEDPDWVCSDCGGSGVGYHSCEVPYASPDDDEEDE